MNGRIQVAVWFLALATAATPVSSQNLVGNGEFQVSTAGWGLLADGSFEWVDDDHDGCVGSGAAELTNEMSTAGEAPAQTCVTGLVGGESYTFGADVLFPSGQSVTGAARAQIYFYPGANCSTSSLGTAFAPSIASDLPDLWLRTENLEAIAPPTIGSALVVVAVQKDGLGPFVARIDHVFVFRGASLLFADGFEAGATCRWSAASPAGSQLM